MCKSAINVLIIEDEQAIADDLAHIVAELGHQVIGIATTHSEATALARERFPDLILSDIKLADRSSGHEAVSEIRQKAQVPVIFITGSPELLHGERRTTDFVIPKPYLEEVLRSTVIQALSCSCPEPCVVAKH